MVVKINCKHTLNENPFGVCLCAVLLLSVRLFIQMKLNEIVIIFIFMI